MKRGNACVWLLALCLSVGMLSGCQSLIGQRLTTAQVEALRQEGFEASDEGWEFSASDRLLFGSNEAALTPAARQTVERIGRLLAVMGLEQVRVDGHSDVTGSSAYNEQLSLRRAEAVAEALAAAGLPASSIQVRGLGRSQPVASNRTAEGRAQNRRVAIVIATR